MMTYAIKYCLGEKYGELMPDAFHIFLSVGAGVGKSFLVNKITEYLKRILKHHDQRLYQPSIFVTASTGKVAIDINGTTLNSAFHLPVKQRSYVQPGAEVLHILRSRYCILDNLAYC